MTAGLFWNGVILTHLRTHTESASSFRSAEAGWSSSLTANRGRFDDR
jgi:hypothetical protein